MAYIMRLVTTEPPHKHPSQHPLALQYAGKPEAAAAPQESAPVDTPASASSDEDEGKTALGE
jgi:hypothetical protein